MIIAENIVKSFTSPNGSFEVLKGANLFIKKGEMTSLIGASGAGKTTLLQIVGGLDQADKGRIIIGGRDISRLNRKELAIFRQTKIGFVFQFHHLLPDFTAIENVLIPGLIAGKSKKPAHERGEWLLEIMGLKDRSEHFPSELSGGERQRVALARALFNEPAVVLADEPTGNLDRKNSDKLVDLFKRTNKELNQTFIFATHDKSFSKELDSTIYIKDGKIITGDDSGSDPSIGEN